MSGLVFRAAMFAVSALLTVGYLARGETWRPLLYGAIALTYWGAVWWHVGREAR